VNRVTDAERLPDVSPDKQHTRHMDFKLSSSRAPLLAPSPLRTGLEGFPFIRLEHSKTPTMNNEDAA